MDGPGIAISNGTVALRACRFARCDAAGSAVVDVAEDRLRMESTVFEDNGGSRAVSVDTVVGEVFASPQLPVRPCCPRRPRSCRHAPLCNAASYQMSQMPLHANGACNPSALCACGWVRNVECSGIRCVSGGAPSACAAVIAHHL